MFLSECPDASCSFPVFGYTSLYQYDLRATQPQQKQQQQNCRILYIAL